MKTVACMQGSPLGGLIIGFLSQHIGVENTVLAQGIIALLIGLLHIRFLQRNKFKKIKPSLVGKQPIDVAIGV